jgi:hypothetical protein
VVYNALNYPLGGEQEKIMKAGAYVNQAAPTIAKMTYPCLEGYLHKGWKLKLVGEAARWDATFQSSGAIRKQRLTRLDEFVWFNCLYDILLIVENQLALEMNRLAMQPPHTAYDGGNGEVLGSPFCRSSIELWAKNEFQLACRIEWASLPMVQRKAKLQVLQLGSSVPEVLLGALGFVEKVDTAISAYHCAESEPANFCI